MSKNTVGGGRYYWVDGKRLTEQQYQAHLASQKKPAAKTKQEQSQ